MSCVWSEEDVMTRLFVDLGGRNAPIVLMLLPRRRRRCRRITLSNEQRGGEASMDDVVRR